MQYEPYIAGSIIVAGIVGAFFMYGDGSPERPKKLPGHSEACTYYAGAKDQELIQNRTQAGRRILRSILMMERKCEFITLVLADGTRHEMVLGPKGRKPGQKAPSSTGYELDW